MSGSREPGAVVTDQLLPPAFWEFFGRSKVVDGQGRPLVVYHGTRQSFSQFDISRLGANVDNPTTSMGHFFTESADGASRWANRRDRRERASWDMTGQNIIPVYLSIQKPRHLNAAKFSHFLKSARPSTINDFIDDSHAKGFDGFRIDYDAARDTEKPLPNETWWVAFRAEQITSAICTSSMMPAQLGLGPADDVHRYQGEELRAASATGIPASLAVHGDLPATAFREFPLQLPRAGAEILANQVDVDTVGRPRAENRCAASDPGKKVRNIRNRP